MPQMDYTLLRGRIRDHGMSQKEVAEKIGVSEGQFCQKMSGNFAFRQDEINRICTLLDIEPAKIGQLFLLRQKLRFQQRCREDSNMADIQIFNNPEFGSIRSIEQNGEPLVCRQGRGTGAGVQGHRERTQVPR